MQESSSKLNQDKKKSKVLIIYNNECSLHTSSRPHPELPFRITAITQQLAKSYPVYQITDYIKQQKSDIQLQKIEKIVTQIHGERYFQFIQYMWDESYKKQQMYINTDTYYMKHTYQAAIQAVKTSLVAIESLVRKRYQYAYAVVRPPGHHSGMKNQPHGFSFFNNVAISAQYAIKSGNFKKIAIIDWDAHHGQGTQNIFYKRKDVLYISLHRYDKGKYFPHLPQSSTANIGQGEGLGFNINICWNLPQKKVNSTFERSESVGDEEYSNAFQQIIIPVLKQYQPDLIIISCGFDSGDGDHIGNLKISKNGYGYMTQQLKKLNTPILVVLQGGYNAEVLKWGSQSVVKILNQQHEDQNLKKQLLQAKSNEIGQKGIQQTLTNIRKQWNI